MFKSFVSTALALAAVADLVKTLEGAGPFTVFVPTDSVRVDAAHVTKADISARNGVIHVIDAVMLPKGL